MANLRTPECVASYPNLFVPKLPKKPKPSDKPKYSVALLFDEEAMKSPEFTAIKAAVIAAARERFGAKADVMIREGKLKLPFLKDIETAGYPDWCKTYIRASSEQKPGVVSKYKDPATDKLIPITDPAEIFAGCKVLATLRPYAYGGLDTGWDPGVGLGLQNVQLRDNTGPRLDGRSAAEDEFDGEERPTGTLGAEEGKAPAASVDAKALDDLLA